MAALGPAREDIVDGHPSLPFVLILKVFQFSKPSITVFGFSPRLVSVF